MAWTLKFGDVQKSFAEWGFSKLHKRKINRKADIVTFIAEGVLLDDDPAFRTDDEIQIYQDDVRWFVGRVKKVRRQGVAESESIEYECYGVLDWLNDLIFRQPWSYLADYANPQSSLNTVYVSNLVLFQKLVGGVASLANIKEQIEEIFAYIISQWAAKSITQKFQLDSTQIPEIQLPYLEIRNLTCAAALDFCFRFTPDMQMWIDYATDIPTVHIAQRGTAEKIQADSTKYLTPVTLTVPEPGAGDGSSLVEVDVRAIEEVVPPAVVLEYLQTNSINGYVTKFVTQDIWPEGSDVTGFRVLPTVIDLSGFNLSFPQGVLSVRAIDVNSVDWWKSHDSTLSRSNVKNIVVREPTRDTALPYELLADSDPWSPFMGGQASEDVIEAFVDYDLTETKNGAEIVVDKVRNQLAQVRLMATDRPSGVYQGPATGSLGEPVPVGLAKALFEMASEVQYEGSVTLEEAECSGSVTIGNTINVVNSKRPEWGSARMMVHQVDEDVDNGRTTLTIGPTQRINIEEILDWLRGFHANNQGYWASRATGLNYSGGALRVGARPHKSAIVANKEARERLVLLRPTNAQPGSGETLQQITDAQNARIILDILDALGLEIKLREYKICIDGTSWYFMALGSDKYQTAKTPNPIGA